MPLPEKEQTLKELASNLSLMAQATAEHSQNWDNFEQICHSMFCKIYAKGMESER